MKTFDYETAWMELARPGFTRLPGSVHLALAEVATGDAAELRQLSDCSMPWPADGGKLRELFDRIDSDDLSRAARVIHDFGHWWPGAAELTKDAPELPNRAAGAHWKFSHYADQVLRERLKMAPRGYNNRTPNGWSFAVHEGGIRLCWQSENEWTWREVAPATEDGMRRAEQARASIALAMDAAAAPKMKYTRAEADQRANARWREMEKLTAPVWTDYDPRLYMIDESEMEARRAARMPAPDREALAQKVRDDYAKTVSEAETKRDGYLWMIARGLPADNAIYYTHTKRWAFGWRRALTPELKSTLLDHLSEFPFDYDIVSPR